MKDVKSTGKRTYSEALTPRQRSEAILEFNEYVEREFKRLKESDSETKSKTEIITDFCKDHRLSYNTLKKWLENQQINRKQENRIRSALDRHFVGCVCHFVKDPEKVLPQILNIADNLIIEAQWPLVDATKLQEIMKNQTEIISDLHKARDLGIYLKKSELSTLDYMKKNIDFVESCEKIADKLSSCKFSIHVGKVAFFKQQSEDDKPFINSKGQEIGSDDVTYILCVNAVPPLRETLNPEDFALAVTFSKAI